MLRISVLNAPGKIQLKLEGKLAHEWVQEAARVWATLLRMNVRNKIIVDLMSVSFVDDPGHQLLAEMRHAGADLMGSGPMMNALIEEIEQTEGEHDDHELEQAEFDSEEKEL
jgi:ABC-type transporter Mla MlaB component